jgi:hypothetical protein
LSNSNLQKLWKYNPQQSIGEIKYLIKRILNNGKLDTILELGIGTGGTMKIWEQLLPKTKNSLLISVDIDPNVKWEYDKSLVDIKVIKGDTTVESTRNTVKEILNGRTVDFLFIDTRHWNDALEYDLINYGGFVRDNGIIALHDLAFFHSYWDRLTWNKKELDDNIPYHRAVEDKIKPIFHKEEIKVDYGIGIFWNIPNQNVIKFREV